MNIQSLLPRSLSHEFIARLDGDVLLIGMRSLLPFEVRSLASRSAEESAHAIGSMVTQGGGQLEVALWTLVMEARIHGRDMERIEEVRGLLSNARRTNTTVARELDGIWAEVEALPASSFARGIEDIVISRLEDYDANYLAMAEVGSTLIEDGAGILTTCFPEHSFFLSLALAGMDGRSFKVYCQETRPYLQGAHLTAPGLAEMGYDHALITDGMVAHVVSSGQVSLYMTASDLATRSSWVVNKVGTLTSAIVCARYGVPYYAFSTGFDDRYQDLEDFKVEFRASDEVKMCQGMDTSTGDVQALYPAFDIIPPDLVAGVVTRGGIAR